MPRTLSPAYRPGMDKAAWTSQRTPVVVGVDGTEAGKEALRVGLSEATLRGCAVEVVTCWAGPR